MTPTHRNPRIRFWVWVGSAEGGYVKLTLKPGQRLEHSSFDRHEEGWSSASTTWTHRGEYLTRESCSDGVDLATPEDPDAEIRAIIT